MEVSDERNLEKQFEFMQQNTRTKEIDRLLKEFWATGLDGRFHEHTMHLAHGYSHAVIVANFAKEIAESVNIEPELAFVAGLLHDAYRPIEKEGKGVEKHGGKCKKISEEILRSSKLFLDDEVRRISDAVRTHDLSLPEEEIILSPLGEVTFIADKSHVNIERVMAYVYDSISYYEEVWYRPSQYFTLLDIIITDVYGKFARDMEWLRKIGRTKEDYEKWCKRALEAHENTMQELFSQRDKEARREDYPKTIRLFWAFKEVISNFRYLIYSERKLRKKEGEDLYRFAHSVIGRYKMLLLTELDLEPFTDILNYRKWASKHSTRSC